MRVQKDKLLGFIRSRESVTFEEIEDYFRARGFRFEGDCHNSLEDTGRLVWHGWNRKASRALLELISEKKVGIFEVGDGDAPIPPGLRRFQGQYELIYAPVVIRQVERR